MGEYQFGPKHQDYMRRALDCTINVAEGAVRAGKTVDNVFVFATLLEDSPDRIHLATGSTIANAKLNLGDCNGMGLERIFAGRCRWGRYRGNECLFVGTRVGQRVVIFAGGRNADAHMRIRGNSYGMWIATEINHHHDNFIREAFNRQLAAQRRKVFWDLNPSAPGSPIYRDYLDRYAGSGDAHFYNYAHFTIHDNPVMTPDRLAEIVSQYDPASVWYRRDILGQRCAAEGLIYRIFADDRARFTWSREAVSALRHINIGVDFGGNRSKTTFVAVGFPEAGGIVALRDHAIAGGKGEIDPARIQGDFQDFLGKLRAAYPGVPIKYAFCDSEAQYLVNGLRRAMSGDHIKILDCAKKPILDRITFVLSLMNGGKFHITKDCPRLSDGLAQAVWVEGEDRRKDDFTSDIDVLDAFEYAVERYMGKV